MFSGNSYHKLQGDPPARLSNNPTIIIPRRPKSRSSNSSTASSVSRLPPVPEQQPKTKPTKALTMKVKELRNWLSDLGDKHQEHYHRFDHHSKSSPPSLTKTTKPTTTTSTLDDGGDDLLGIQSKPSMASTCPSTAILEDNTNDPLFAGSFSSDEEDAPSDGRTPSDLYLRTGESASTRKLFNHDDGVKHVTTKDHQALLLKQAPRTQEEGFGSSNSDNGSSYNENDEDRDDRNAGGSKSCLFRDQMLTKATLDAMSHNPDATGLPPKTLGEQLLQLNENYKHQKEKQQQESDSEKDAFYLGDDEEEDSFQTDSTDAPSIGPGVLVSKLANIFLNDHAGRGDSIPPPPAPERRKYVNPQELSFLRSSESHSVVPREDLAYANPPKTPTTTVGKGIRKFGGPRKTLVERRKEQLHEKFGDTRTAVFVQKKTWGQKTPHGKYQRTTRVEKMYK